MNLFDQDPTPYLNDANGAAAPEDVPNGLPRRPWDALLEVRQRYNPEDTSPENNYGRFAIGGRLQDYTGGIVEGARAQILFEENSARRYLIIVNLDETETLWIRPGGLDRAAVIGQCLPLNPAPAAGQGGGVYVMESNAIDTSPWTVIATTTGHRFVAYEL